MISSPKTTEVLIRTVRVANDQLEVDLSDGRTISIPVSWYPRLSHARDSDLAEWELIGGGHGVHWPKIDEDISVSNIVAGEASGESARSFEKWKRWYQDKS